MPQLAVPGGLACSFSIISASWQKERRYPFVGEKEFNMKNEPNRASATTVTSAQRSAGRNRHAYSPPQLIILGDLQALTSYDVSVVVE